VHRGGAIRFRTSLFPLPLINQGAFDLDWYTGINSKLKASTRQRIFGCCLHSLPSRCIPRVFRARAAETAEKKRRSPGLGTKSAHPEPSQNQSSLAPQWNQAIRGVPEGTRLGDWEGRLRGELLAEAARAQADAAASNGKRRQRAAKARI
jgi:hypothetical protein